MGRIVDLCGEVAAAADEGPDGLILASDVWDRLRKDWTDEDIDDALGLVHDSLLQAELVEAADSLSAHMLDVLGTFSDPLQFQEAEAGEARIPLEIIGQLARRVSRLEEILDAYREGGGPDRSAFDELRQRLANHGLEDYDDDAGEQRIQLEVRRSRPQPRNDDESDD
jgi:hypothetical protein